MGESKIASPKSADEQNRTAAAATSTARSRRAATGWSAAELCWATAMPTPPRGRVVEQTAAPKPPSGNDARPRPTGNTRHARLGGGLVRETRRRNTHPPRPRAAPTHGRFRGSEGNGDQGRLCSCAPPRVSPAGLTAPIQTPPRRPRGRPPPQRVAAVCSRGTRGAVAAAAARRRRRGRWAPTAPAMKNAHPSPLPHEPRCPTGWPPRTPTPRRRGRTRGGAWRSFRGPRRRVGLCLAAAAERRWATVQGWGGGRWWMAHLHQLPARGLVVAPAPAAPGVAW